MAEIMDDDALVLLGVCCVPLADSVCLHSIRLLLCATISIVQIIVMSGVILFLL